MFFQFKRFLKDNFPGGAPEVMLYCDLYLKRNPGRSAVMKWMQRNSIPAEWFALLCVIVELERGHANVSSYLTGDKDAARR